MRQKLSDSLEDYLEAIFNLTNGLKKEARSKDIADRLCVSRASVTGALRLLKERGLANYVPYGTITLTPTGRRRAAEVAGKHSVLKTFFTNVLGVDHESAQKGACRAEHALGQEIIDRLMCFTQFIESDGSRRLAIREFQGFWEDCRKDMNRKRS